MSVHTYACHVRFSDVDVYGHVNNVKYLEFFQEARVAFARDVLSETGDDPLGRMVVARVDVDYKRPMLFRPEPYTVESWVAHVGGASYHLDSRILDDAGTVHALAHVVIVGFDVTAQRAAPLSEVHRARLADYAGG